ncbi:hypothetical protein ACWV26_06720 [Rummeliibacillus sp. JY-2-4R]
MIWGSKIDVHERGSLKESLNEFGEEGWELVSVTTQVGSNSNTEFKIEKIYTSDTIFYFKREI